MEVMEVFLFKIMYKVNKINNTHGNMQACGLVGMF